MSMKPRSRNPYIGPRAFQDGETLYGRDREVKKLLNLLIAERIVLLYSPSGAGKTSLIQAALIPELRAEGFRVFPVIRVGLEPPPNHDLPDASNRYLLSTLLSLEEGLPPKQQKPLTELGGMDLSTYLDQRSTETEETDGDVLIFDQFEEVLTINPTDQTTKAEFFVQLGQALHPRNRWALFAMREEYFAGLDPYLYPIPTRFSTTFRRELLGVKAAREAMQEPARQAGVPFNDFAAAKLIDDLRRVQVQQPDGTMTERPGTSIEPVQLQVVCYRLWENLPNDATEIRETDIQEADDVDSALAGYYADRVKAIAGRTGVRERTIREWFDRQLITEQGIRGQVLRGPEQSQGLENQAIAPLVDAHLVRAENRRGATWYELAHDRLIEPIRTNNLVWFQEHLSMLQRQAALWEEQHRPEGLLLYDQSLDEAEQWAVTHQQDMTPSEQGFLTACQKARTQIHKERCRNRLIQILAVVAGIISVIALVFFFQARQSEHTAIQAKNEAEERREEAERQSAISLARTLSFQALQEQEHYQDTRAALLTRQAYLLNQRYQGGVLPQIDKAFRSVLDALRFRCIMLGHKGKVYSVAFSTDGKRLATGSEDKMVWLWDLTTPDAEPIILRGHDAPVLSVAFSPDGKKLVSSSWDKTVRLWDLTTPDATPAILSGYDGLARSVAFNLDGRTLALGCDDNTVRLWDLTTPDAEPIILRGHNARVQSVAFGPNGKKLASSSIDKTVRLWDLTKPDMAPIILRGHDSWVYSVAFSPDGQILASGSWDKTVQLWDLTKLDTAPTVLSGHDDVVYSVAFSPDGKTLVSGSWDRTVRIWDLTKPYVRPSILRGHDEPVQSVAFNPDGKRLASGSWDKTVRLWDLTTFDMIPTILRSHEDIVQSVAFNPDSKTLASGSWDETVRLWDLTTPGAAPIILCDHENSVLSVVFSPDGQTLASGSSDKTIRLWNLTMPDIPPTVLRGHESWVQSLAFSPDGKTLASGSYDKTVRLWDLSLPEATPTVLLSHEEAVLSVAFSPDGKTLASGSWDRTVRLWDLTQPEAAPIVLRGHDELVNSVVFSPDGERLASGSSDKTIRLWDLTAPNVAPTILRGHEMPVLSVAFSSDGQMLASGSWDKTVRLWDLTTSDMISTILHGHKNVISSVAFSPDGQILASGSRDKTIRLWNWRTENLAEMVCEKVWRNLTMEEWSQFVSPDISYERTCPNLPEGK